MTMTDTLSSLLALPGYSQEIEIEPGVTLNIDPAALEANKDKILAYCRALPASDILSWKYLSHNLQDNEVLSKLLIALGDSLGAWIRHPPIGLTEAWTADSPSVLYVHPAPIVARVPKPSTGVLEADLVTCPRCYLQMGPPGSTIHDYVEAYPGAECITEDPEECEMWEDRPEEKNAQVIPVRPDQEVDHEQTNPYSPPDEPA